MSNRPKTKSKIQYGDSPTQPAGAKAGKSNAGAGASGGNPMGAKIAIGAALLVVLITVIVFAVQDGGGDSNNKVAFQSATVTGDALPDLGEGAADPAVGQTIPTIVGKSFDGSKVEIKPGGPQIIAVLAHWCPHCQSEVPKIAQWQADGELDSKVKITGVSTAADESRGNFPPASWLEKEEWKNPTMVDTPTSAVLNALGVTGFPTLIAVKDDGTVALRLSGELSLDQVKSLASAALGEAVEPVEETPGTTPITSPVPTTAAP